MKYLYGYPCHIKPSSADDTTLFFPNIKTEIGYFLWIWSVGKWRSDTHEHKYKTFLSICIPGT